MKLSQNLRLELFSVSLIIIAVVSRIIPHPPNFAPITAIALLGAYSFSNKFKSFFIPLIAMLISDVFIGFHTTIWAVYLSFALIVLLGFNLRKAFSFSRLFVITSASSFLFYLITNFAVWLLSGLYPHTLAGLLQCYTFGLPFYRTTTLELFALSYLGDISYTFILFGVYKIAERKVKFQNT
ncbi:MAG: hypothetical protein N2517_02320 [Ignavibacteria bacterium]|nr:hypothetical protein [Ignavibacteria bacterium]